MGSEMCIRDRFFTDPVADMCREQMQVMHGRRLASDVTDLPDIRKKLGASILQAIDFEKKHTFQAPIFAAN